MAEPTWLTGERPIMESIDARTRSSRGGPTSADITTDTGLDQLDVELGLRDLEAAHYITGGKLHEPSGRRPVDCLVVRRCTRYFRQPLRPAPEAAIIGAKPQRRDPIRPITGSVTGR